ncbi:MAG: MmcQ/YjbR family DNA-binding protein [Bacilli bacterium]|nr:MmcQ/YjbR family DNA-binding protein [Bacilli bacterium]
MFEEEIFKKSIIDYDKCLKYGFVKEQDIYIYKKDILNNEFQVIITITNNIIKGKIIEKELNEEYFNYRIENQIGEFVNNIRDEYKKILLDIKDKCTKSNTFIYPQTNRINNWIKDTFSNNPEFLWDDDKNAVYRHDKTKKWYGIIMEINKNKLTKENKLVEVMNVKLPPDLINDLLKKEGFYKAYHMNKKYWISFILDDSIKDQELEELINISFTLTK